MTLIFSVHYFLWYGALASIFGYESVYARHYTNASTMQYGILNTVLPFATVIVTPIVCSMADRRHAHRSYFIMSLVITAICLCFYALLPLLMDTGIFVSDFQHAKRDPRQSSGDLYLGPWIYFCIVSLVCGLATGVNTCLSDSFAVLQAEEQGSSFGRIIVWGTFGWASSALILSLLNQFITLPRLMAGILFGILLLVIDVVVVSFWGRRSDFRLDVISTDAASTVTGSTSSAHRDPSDYMPFNESARVNLGKESIVPEQDPTNRRQAQPETGQQQKYAQRAKSADDNHSSQSASAGAASIHSNNNNSKQPQFDQTPAGSQLNESSGASSIKTINSELGTANPTTSSGVNNAKSQSDTFDQHPQQQQQQQQVSTASKNPRAAGGGGSEPSSPVSIGTIDQFGHVVASADKIRTTLDRSSGGSSTAQFRPSVTNFRMQMLLLGLILLRRKALIRYFILFILSGFFMSMHWNYFFLYLEIIYYESFEIISAVSMIGQSILGELPFFILSRKVIDICGRSHTLSISLISIGVRFIIYGYMLPNVSMFCVLLADCFQGPNYGLFYVVMTEVGLEFSYCDNNTIERLAERGEIDRNDRRQVDCVRLALRSTIQSVAFACYEGIGVGLGSLAGGWIVHHFGYENLWLSMAIGSITVGFANILVELMCREHDPEDESSERREYMKARRKASLRNVASQSQQFVASGASSLLQAASLEPPQYEKQQQSNKQQQQPEPSGGGGGGAHGAAKVLQSPQRPLARKIAGPVVAPPAATVAKKGD